MPDPLAWKDAVLQYMQGNSPSGKKFSGRGSDGTGGVYNLFADLSSKGAAAGTLLGGVPIAKIVKPATVDTLDALVPIVIKRLGRKRLEKFSKYFDALNTGDPDIGLRTLSPDELKASGDVESYIGDMFKDAVRHNKTGETIPMYHQDLTSTDTLLGPDDPLDVLLGLHQKGFDSDEISKFRDAYNAVDTPDTEKYVSSIYDEGMKAIRDPNWRGGATIIDPNTGELNFAEHAPGNMTPEIETEFLMKLLEYIKKYRD